MAKERLSKLQKWILKYCLKNLNIHYRDVFEFFGKKFTKEKPRTVGEGYEFEKYHGENYMNEYNIEKIERKSTYPGYEDSVWRGYEITVKKELCITNSEKAIISRSLKNLATKGFLIQSKKWGKYILTEEGFLKANNYLDEKNFVSFKEYQQEIQDREEKHRKALEEMFARFRKAKS